MNCIRTLRPAFGALLLALPLGFTPIGCGPSAQSSFCADMEQTNDGCWSEDAANQCEEAYAECPANVVTLESCPVQFACG